MLNPRRRIRNSWSAALVFAFASLHLPLAFSSFSPGRNNGKVEKGENSVRLTLEITWGPHGLPQLPDAEAGQGPAGVQDAVLFEMGDGRVLDGKSIAAHAGFEPGPSVTNQAVWSLGRTTAGGVRLRVESAPSANFYVTAGGQRTQFSLSGLVDGTQRSLPQFPIQVSVKRLDWDELEVRLPEGNGLVSAGAQVPVTVGFNILSAEAEPITLRYRADLKPVGGGDAVWRYPGGAEAVTTNSAVPPVRRFDVAMPVEAGTYVLEVEATWDQAGAQEGTRLTRWLKRKRPGINGVATRRVTLVVPPSTVKGESSTVKLPADDLPGDAVDLGRGHSSHAFASGRSAITAPGRRDWPVPVSTLTAPGFRDRLRDWSGREDLSVLGPVNPSGLAWVASELKVQRPGKPHRLRVTLTGGHPDALGVALLAPSGAEGAVGRVFLDTQVSSSPVEDPKSPVVQSWLVWPDVEHPVVVLCNRGERSEVRVGSIELDEVAEPVSLTESDKAASTRGRGLALDLTGTHALTRFGGVIEGTSTVDMIVRTRNLISYARSCGATAMVLPDHLSDRQPRSRLDGQFLEDSTAPDALHLMLRLLAAQGMSSWISLDLSGTLPGLPAPDSAEAQARNLVRINGNGAVDRRAYQVLHPQVRAAVAQRIEDVVRPGLDQSKLHGVVIRMGAGPTILGLPDTGLDDLTYAAFVRENFPAQEAGRVPAKGTDAPGRFSTRAQFVTTAARTVWLDWRADKLGQVYADWARGVETLAPGLLLGVVTPGVDDGPAGLSARRAERAGLTPDSAWREVGVELKRWPSQTPSLVVFRGSSLTPDALAHDVATSPELDDSVARVTGRGVWLDCGTRAAGTDRLLLQAPPTLGDEPLGHAVAGTDPRWIMIAVETLAGQEERLARFARLFQALPASMDAGPPVPRLSSGVALRSWKANNQTYISLANDSPYEVRQTCFLRTAKGAVVDDLGSGSRLKPVKGEDGTQELVLQLPPFGVTALRIADLDATIEPGPTHLPELGKLEAQAERLVARLGRLNKPNSLIGPPSPGFEVVEPGVRPTALLAEIRTSDGSTEPIEGDHRTPAGWMAFGDPLNVVGLDRDRVHTGSGALRLNARVAPALVVSEPFLPPGGAALIIHSWFKADREGMVRVWVESEAAGVLNSRLAEVPVTTDWSERLVRISGLPPEGLDTLRLRYEWLGSTPSTLWIDDVTVEGQGPSEPSRRTQRVLLEALQAFRARRYADFARLLGSHRVRTATQRLASGESSDLIRTGQAADSDLPPERRVR